MQLGETTAMMSPYLDQQLEMKIAIHLIKKI